MQKFERVASFQIILDMKLCDFIAKMEEDKPAGTLFLFPLALTFYFRFFFFAFF